MTQTEALRLALEALEMSDICADDCKCTRKRAINGIKAALEAKDEPVAWIKRSAKGNIYDLLSEPDDGYEPVYTTPPQRKPLTDEEIHQIFIANSVAVDNGNAYMVAGLRTVNITRAIEAKLKEKNYD